MTQTQMVLTSPSGPPWPASAPPMACWAEWEGPYPILVAPLGEEEPVEYPQPRRVTRGERRTRLMVAGRIRTDQEADVREVAVVADVGHPKGPMAALWRIPGTEVRQAVLPVLSAALDRVFTRLGGVLMEECGDDEAEVAQVRATLHGRGNQR